LPDLVKISSTPRQPFFGYWQKVTLILLCVTMACFYWADTEIIALEPWSELQRIGLGFLSPDFLATEYLLEAVWQTISFALLGVAAGLLFGAPVALFYNKPVVAAACAFIRSIHELFWALLFLQVFGLSPLTGVLAIALPYGATFARVFSDILQQAPVYTLQNLPANTDKVSRYIYGRFAHVMNEIKAYVRYRFECALRSSAILGFVGMPTLGFYLETAFRQGHYHQGAALLILFIIMIGTIPFWCRAKLLPLYFIAAIWLLPEITTIDSSLVWRFLSDDILPPMFQSHSMELLFNDKWQLFAQWFYNIVTEQAIPGIVATVLLAVAALGFSYLLALLMTTFSFKPLTGTFIARISNFILLILRSVPEYIFAYIFMLLLGPSMLPAIIALAIHNGALVAYLTGRQSATTSFSRHFNGKIDGYAYDILPRIYPNMMALLFYRFEVILRETAILGMLGVATLGFYIDSNFSEIRFNGALVLIGATALLNILIDIASRRLLVNGSLSHKPC
jgi:phosphonate transport system permease protein